MTSLYEGLIVHVYESLAVPRVTPDFSGNDAQVPNQGVSMYFGLKHAHTFSAVLLIFLTAVWTIVAWHYRPEGSRLAGKTKGIYIGQRIIAGVTAVTGVMVTFAGPWQMMIFPYIGLMAFFVYELAAGASKRFISSGYAATNRRAALLLQLTTLVVSAHVMATKPF